MEDKYEYHYCVSYGNEKNFGKYLDMVISGKEIVVTKNGHEVGRFVPKDNVISYLTNSLISVLKEDYNLDEIKTEILKEKYGVVY